VEIGNRIGSGVLKGLSYAYMYTFQGFKETKWVVCYY